MRDHDAEQRQAALQFTRRGLVLGLGQAAVFGALASRLYQVQVLEGAVIAARAEDNRTRQFPVAAVRGRILDATGLPLATNREVFRAILQPQRNVTSEAATARSLATLFARVAPLLGLSEEDQDRLVVKAWRSRREPFVIADGLTFEQAAAVQVNGPDLPGISAEPQWQRSYQALSGRNGEAMAHLVGYVGALDKRALDDTPVLRLAGTRVGKTGVEAGMEADLRGVPGTVVVEVDARGRHVRRLGETRPLPGRDVTLSVDVALQSAVMERLSREANPGAVVALEIATGEVLVMASTPTFDPARMTGPQSKAVWHALNTDKRRPLVNRCIAGQYPPGSTFKMVTALAALEDNALTTKEKIECWGDVTYAGHMFRCWNRKGHIASDLHKALRESCDCYFYEAARRVGMDKIALMAKKLGLGQTYEAGIAQQKAGLIPTPAWKRQINRKTGWLIGETVLSGIGQGYVLTTPLQLAVMTARIASGRVVMPTLVRRPAGDPPPAFAALDIAATSLAAVRRGMAAVVNEAGGTGQAADLDDGHTLVAGKTGTSQVSRLSAERDRTVALKTHERDHAVFVAYTQDRTHGPAAPPPAPKYAVAVLLEHAGGGGAQAGPMVRDVLALLAKHERRPALPAFAPDADGPPPAPSVPQAREQSLPGPG
jgi:penicillin-binding protein 2